MRDGAVTRCARKSLQSIGEACFSIRQPKLRIKWNGQPGVCLCRDQWHEYLLEIAIAA
ncbi:hypothetical protein ALO43_101562 [Pseudomonas tremae]|uniref:Uncharacterized protein n=2 Tax=Pseudomonas syringae group TaxID=136849 RepID=A0ABR5L2M3_PSESG|nr:Uncharacterized protein AC498_4935 [Pseudomonas savastanoi pv. glycinea]KPC38174.1 Uncharacterized protein AC496_3069 [Pseudomonas savastanoi pv. glycinea]KPY91877.1 hypothetical protein ALO43_101562 [Pseudomonas tremae]RMS43520.1 hypothetical protein ALP67_102807 [Pseudomonas ficuserectae]